MGSIVLSPFHSPFLLRGETPQTFALNFNQRIPYYLEIRLDLIHRGVEQWLARWAHNPKAGGSNPSPAIFYSIMAV